MGAKTVQVVDSIQSLRAARANLNGRVGLVPTMGALHEGHLALARAARADNDRVMATIFVNPTQFAPGEDLEKYPRNLARDLSLFDEAGVDLAFTPPPDLMYPAGYQTYIDVEQVTQPLEGARRPDHFRGVATVVAKLFNLTQPTVAYFGQKDAQQVVVIRRMARDLDFPLDISICPTIREPDGLALSSRNVYLEPEQRAAALALYGALRAAAAAYEAGERQPDTLRMLAQSTLDSESLITPQYVSLADPRTLQEQREPTTAPLLLSLAAHVGATRLIDNMLLPTHLNGRNGLTAVLGASD
jgi:pantoate--beta-alanine ligase